MANSDKKRLLFVIDSLRNGGIAQSFSQLLKEIDYTLFEVTVVIFHWEESYARLIPNGVRIERVGGLISLMNATGSESRKKGLFHFLIKKAMAVLCLIFGANLVYSILFRRLKKTYECDIAISYTNNLSGHSTYFGSNKFVIEKVSAKTKCSWLHVDYEKYKLNNRINNAEYRKMDRVITVSEATKRTFLSFLPDLEGKCQVFYNLIDENVILELAKEGKLLSVNQNKTGLRIVSIGRLDKKKNMADCLEISNVLKINNVVFEWLIIGEGPERNHLAARIKRYGLADSCFLIGHQRNPYVYLASSDLLVSTSKTESFGLAIMEAHVLGIPSLVVKYPAAEEIVCDGVNGYLFDAKEDVAKAIVTLFQDNKKLLELKKTCKVIIGRRNINVFIESLSA